MKKSLTQNGNSWQLYINKPIAQMLRINDKEYTVKLIIEQNILKVSKADENDKNTLIKKLIKRGSGFGLNFSIPILELLNINPEKDTLDVNTENSCLVVKKSDK